MNRILIIIFCLTFCPKTAAQFSPERLALNRMEKGKWKSAEESLRKALRKDSANTEVNFIFSWFYNTPENPASNVDSAYRYSILALRDFSKNSPKEKERLKRFPIDSQILIRQRKKIDSIAFEHAKDINTIKAYTDFLSKFTYADELATAIELRDEVAYLDALKINTCQSFKDYLLNYPSSARAGDARQRYEKILYLDKTRDGKLASYEAFYREFTDSPYRDDAERNIFEITTASGKISAFTGFLKRFPTSRFQSKIMAIIYHLSKEEDKEPPVLSDSLKEVRHLDNGYWVPVLRNGKFGFINQSGNETISPKFDSVKQEYVCGNIRTDFLVVTGGIINRAGYWIIKDHIREVQDIGAGFLKIVTENCRYVVHKSALGLSRSCHEDSKLIARNFIAFKDHGQWGLNSLMGKELFPVQFDDVQALDTMIILIKNGKKTLVTLEEVESVADKNPLSSSLVFDDVRFLDKGIYWVKNGPLEGVINEKLEFVVPLDRQTITKSEPGFILEQNKKYKLSGVSPLLDHHEFDHVLFYGKWIKLQLDDDLQLYSIEKNRMEGSFLDSLWFEKELAFARKHDSLKVYLKSGSAIGFLSATKVNFMKSPDSSQYFFVPEKNKKAVINAETGKQLFSFDADDLQCIGNSVFVVSKGNKKGLLNQEGKILIPLDYMAIVPLTGEWVSLLKDKKFGLYNSLTHKLVKPAYDRNVSLFSKNLLIACKEGRYGFINRDSKPQSAFEFEEIRPWNDTAAWVKKDFQWMIYVIPTHKIAINNIKEYHYVQNTLQEKIAVIRRGVGYGVISSTRGEVIPSNFSDIVNVGSPEEPMYFSEKNVEEAGIHVVIYYDKSGKLLRKQVYEEEEYERIYCTGN